MLVPRLANSIYSRIISGVDNALKNTGYNLLIAGTENNVQKEKELLESLQYRMVDAILVASSSTDASFFSEINKGIPIILIDRRIEQAKLDLVASNDREASFQIVNYIFQMGHRHVAIIKGVNDLSITKDRLSGYIDALNQNGIELNSQLQLDCDFTSESAYYAVQQLLSNTPRSEWPTAIYSTNTSMTEGAMGAVYNLGLSIPDDISIVSFGEMSLPSFFKPQVTCVSRKAEVIGETAGKIALRRIRQCINNEKYDVESLIVYSSIKYGDSVKNMNS